MTSLIIALGLAIVWLMLCGLVAEFADHRGHSAILWYVVALLFTPLLAYFIVGMLPSAADLMPAGYSRCATCGGAVPAEAQRCPHCHADVSAQRKREKLAA